MVFGAVILFAQRQGFNQGFNQGFQAGDNIGGGICHSLHLLIYLGVLVYVMIMNYNALGAISPRNQDMQPGMVFLLLIPCFNLVWYFFVVSRVASSLEKGISQPRPAQRRRFRQRRRHNRRRPGMHLLLPRLDDLRYHPGRQDAWLH